MRGLVADGWPTGWPFLSLTYKYVIYIYVIYKDVTYKYVIYKNGNAIFVILIITRFK